MISKGHKKHALLAKPAYGNFGRNEWAIVGTKCDIIKALSRDIIKALSPLYKCAYVDTKHQDETDIALPGLLDAGAALDYTDHTNFHQLNFTGQLTAYQYRNLFANTDLLLVNGNHHEASAQVLVIDNSKKVSIQKRVSQLDNIQLILFANDLTEPFDFIQEALPHWREIPQFSLGNTSSIIDFFTKEMLRAKPPINGLVLAGGKSERLGHDKGKIQWHGKEQRYYVADMLSPLCSEIFISCRADQQNEIDSSYQTLPDTFTGLGPYGAILSAFRHNPDAAWLIIACDLPLIDDTALQNLIQNRDSSRIATTFQNPHDGLPEPLITIWEPKSYPVLLSFLSQGNSCPRKVLRNNDVKIIQPSQPESLMNVNTSEDSEIALNILNNKKPKA